MTLTFQHSIAPPLTNIDPILVGAIPQALGTPDVYLIVETANLKSVRVDINFDTHEANVFREASFWEDWVVIGFGHRACLLNPETRMTVTIELGSYFRHFYQVENMLLVASAEKLFSINQDGKLNWISAQLAIDGVVIDQIVGEIVIGKGEWDPPDGWREFRVNKDSGELA